jgi:hypothetical protein
VCVAYNMHFLSQGCTAQTFCTCHLAVFDVFQACEATYHTDDAHGDPVLEFFVRTPGGGFYGMDGVYTCGYTLSTAKKVAHVPTLLTSSAGNKAAGTVLCPPPVQDPANTEDVRFMRLVVFLWKLWLHIQRCAAKRRYAHSMHMQYTLPLPTLQTNSLSNGVACYHTHVLRAVAVPKGHMDCYGGPLRSWRDRPGCERQRCSSHHQNKRAL